MIPERCKSPNCGRWVARHSFNGLCAACEDALWDRYVATVPMKHHDAPTLDEVWTKTRLALRLAGRVA